MAVNFPVGAQRKVYASTVSLAPLGRRTYYSRSFSNAHLETGCISTTTIHLESREDELHIVFQEGQLLSDMRSQTGCLIAYEQIKVNGWTTVRRQFLGYWDGRPCYVLEIAGVDIADPMQYQKGSLYHILGRVDEQLFALAGRASQLLDWERDHQYWWALRKPDDGGRSGKSPCAVGPVVLSITREFRPVLLFLITRGEELLLARNTNFPQPMYSTLAGFIEAGETAEQTLVREVREEVGVEVRNLRYFQSQSWPFPNQLMLGYFAEHDSGEIVCDPTEIADAQWFHYKELPLIPPASSISGQLIQHYIESLN